ncbi:hypothetical protein [Streptomyces cyaneofuscatus]|uniref:hypothetical protein n=1 Tax=Streptomyces cyaneofuscatus TaxID=66883 RepID=UPI0036DB234D
MTALPGQRSAQRPWRAVTSAQRALGRAAQSAAGGLGSAGIAFIDGQTYDVDLTAPDGVQMELREDPPPPMGSEDIDQTERQG